MSPALSFFTLLLVFSRADALYGNLLSRCQFSSHDGHDAVYLEQFYFNKILEVQYNSTLGKVIGYTTEGKTFADILNNNPGFIHHEQWKTEFCRRGAQRVYGGLLTPVEPSVWVRSVEAAGSKHPGMLICSVYNFYPKQIRVTWLRNGKETTSDVMSSDEMPNGNWLYQVHSFLEYTPRPGEKISCKVEHASLVEPQLHEWEPMSDSGMYKIIVGIAGLLLGLVFSVGGLMYYKKKSSERVLVPTTEVFYPENTL
ncbi:H-2 class II histocompatibility antigen, E-S beta chain-like [Pagrus major]|uniref:H-2 class II histocompatibility antigen, E-S beta chain-like n=1 Tax=Pagrus major TaxID=143350 RepID=UPI003CC8DA6A